MEHNSAGTGNGVSDPKGLASGVEVVIEIVIQESHDKGKYVEEDPDTKKDSTTTLVDHPRLQALLEGDSLPHGNGSTGSSRVELVQARNTFAGVCAGEPLELSRRV